MSGFLYRAYDADAALLYIGASIDPGRRFSEHGSQTSWWREVRTITLEAFDSRELALVAEADAIVAEGPRYNIQRTALNEFSLLERAAARRQREEEATRRYYTEGRVVCTNCGQRPFKLPKGVLLGDVACPTCEYAGLTLEPAEDAA